MSDKIEVEIPVGDGKAIRTEIDWPALEIIIHDPAKAVEAGVMAHQVATAITAGLEADIVPFLPPAAPGRKVIQRDAAGLISGVLEYPPTPQPEVAALAIRRAVIAQLIPPLANHIAGGVRDYYATASLDS